MNRYVKEIMDRRDDLPKTFEEYQLLDKNRSRVVPLSHVQKLRDEYDAKQPQRPSLGKINF